MFIGFIGATILEEENECALKVEVDSLDMVR
jgi:hypothetical protein